MVTVDCHSHVLIGTSELIEILPVLTLYFGNMKRKRRATIMATREEIEATYNYMDEVFRVSLGEHGDVTCALYNGDFTKTLKQAQQDKHDYILDAIHFNSGSRVLDIGCGWGPMLKAVKERGGLAIGL